MTPVELNEIKDRLSIHARTVQDNPPDTILADGGGPSQAVMGYRKKHNLTLDWMLLGKGPQHCPQAITLSDVADDMTFLHALLQGLDVLIGEAPDCKKARNAAYALSQEVVKKCDGIMSDLHEVEMGAGK